VRRAAALALSRIGGQRAADLLAAEATNNDSPIQRDAAKYLSFIDRARALSIILSLVRNPSYHTLIWVLRDLAEPSAVPVLIDLLNSPYDHVRHDAANALASMRDRRAIAPLIRALQEETADDQHMSVEPALRLLTGQDFGYFHGAPDIIRRHAWSRWYSWQRAGCPNWPPEQPSSEEMSGAVQTVLRWLVLGKPPKGATETPHVVSELESLAAEKVVVLYGDDLPADLNLSLPGKSVMVLSTRQAHERAAAVGNYLAIHLQERPRVAYGFAEISLDAVMVAPPWDHSWGLAGGVVLLRKEGDTWRFHTWEAGWIA